MQLTITLRQEVKDVDEAKEIYIEVKEHLTDRPKIKVTAHVTNHFPESEEPS